MNRADVDLTGAKILLVDDLPDNLRVLRQALEPKGYRILIATSGETALRVARSMRPDLILLDVQMPGMDGFETCRRLKGEADTRDIPVIFVTARTETESVVEGFGIGGVDYIVKPFQTEEILARVQTHLKIDRLSRELHESNRALSSANKELFELNRELQQKTEALERANQALSIANDQIQEATRRKSQFLASMSHELRTPMNAILGFTDLVLRRAGDLLPEQQRDNLLKVKLSADHLLNLINDLLDLSKIEAGRMDVRAAPFEVKRLIVTCCATVSPLVKPGVALDYEIADDVGEAHTDEARLRQIIINLLSNALKFTEQGEVKVRVARPPTADRRPPPSIPGPPSSVVRRPSEDGLLEIAVSDTGIGIPPDALNYIFDEFRQVEGGSQQHKGTGLGLSITKKLTELLGGTIEVESAVGKGSTFTVRIPTVYGSGDR